MPNYAAIPSRTSPCAYDVVDTRTGRAARAAGAALIAMAKGAAEMAASRLNNPPAVTRRAPLDDVPESPRFRRVKNRLVLVEA